MSVESSMGALAGLLNQHRTFRQQCLNMIASENRPSPLVEGLLVEDLSRRYGNYSGIDFINNRFYQGNRFIGQIEDVAHQLARRLFGVAHADLRPLSGNVAGIAAVAGLARPDDTVLELANGHCYAAKLAGSSLRVRLRPETIPWDGPNYNIDLDGTVALIKETRPRLVVVGSGVFLFPQPVRQLREALDRYSPDSYLIYDAAHVCGLIAGGGFQDPFGEGADVVISSTHKTLAGPQGGLVLTDSQDLAERIGPAIQPLIVGNHHLGRLPSLAATFAEWIACGAEQAAAVVANAKGLARQLHQRGVPLVGQELDFTESHTLVPIVDSYGEGKALADRLEDCHIVAGAMALPAELGRAGLRLGVQELTRWGMEPEDTAELAECIVDCLEGRDLAGVRQRATAMAGRFDQCRFSLDEGLCQRILQEV